MTDSLDDVETEAVSVTDGVEVRLDVGERLADLLDDTELEGDSVLEGLVVRLEV